MDVRWRGARGGERETVTDTGTWDCKRFQSIWLILLAGDWHIKQTNKQKKPVKEQSGHHPIRCEKTTAPPHRSVQSFSPSEVHCNAPVTSSSPNAEGEGSQKATQAYSHKMHNTHAHIHTGWQLRSVTMAIGDLRKPSKQIDHVWVQPWSCKTLLIKIQSKM